MERVSAMNYERFAAAFESRMNSASFGEKFRLLASLYVNLPYIGGRENFVYGADCSGTVCGPLWLMGYNIRCTADALYNALFTTPVERHEDLETVMAVFCKTQVEREHFGRMVPVGHVTHVAPVIGRYVVQNAFDPIQPMSTAYLYEWYSSRDYDVEWRQIDKEALERHSAAKDLLYGIDPVLDSIRRQYGTG